MTKQERCHSTCGGGGGGGGYGGFIPHGCFDRLEELKDVGQTGYAGLDSRLVEHVKVQSNGQDLWFFVFDHEATDLEQLNC